MKRIMQHCQDIRSDFQGIVRVLVADVLITNPKSNPVTLQKAFNSKPIRFIVVGTWNTAFAYFTLAFFYYLLSDKTHYLIILAFTGVLNITNAFLCHKFFVFKTRGNYVKEYLRYYAVYSIPLGMGFVVFPFCIEVLHMNFYVTQAMLTVVTVFISYYGHKHVSFRQNR